MGDYEDAKDEAQREMRRVASRREVIYYSGLVQKIKSLDLEPDSAVLARILDESSSSEAERGRGMLSAVVIHKGDDYLPGPGFFALAKRLGRAFTDRRAFHAVELERVYAANARR